MKGLAANCKTGPGLFDPEVHHCCVLNGFRWQTALSARADAKSIAGTGKLENRAARGARCGAWATTMIRARPYRRCCVPIQPTAKEAPRGCDHCGALPGA